MIKRISIYGITGVCAAILFFGVGMYFRESGRAVVVQHNAPVSTVLGNTGAADPAPRKIDYARILNVFRGKDVERVSVREKVFALTFDGGGNANGVQKILDVLSAHHIAATFFLTGHFIKTFPDAVAAIQKSGGEIANHTMDHKDLSKLSKEEIAAQITGMEETAKARGTTVVPFFRFPYGAPTKDAIALANEHGYVSVRWTVDSLGWEGNVNGHDAAFVADRVIQKAVPGGIALMHLGSAGDHSTLDADALERVITTLEQQGYRIVPLSELFNEAIKNTAP